MTSHQPKLPTPDKKSSASYGIKKADLLLIGFLLLLAFTAFGIRSFLHRTPAVQVQISIDGELQTSLPLNENFEGNIETKDGNFNTIVIQNQTVSVTSSSCPNKDCIRQGSISHNGEQIVCLPNKVSILILGSP